MGFQMQPYGMQAMLKEGHKHLSGLDEAVLKNIDACKQLSVITRTSLGPNGNSFHFSCVFLTETFLETSDQFPVHKRIWILNRVRFDRYELFMYFFSFCDSGMNKMVINHLDKLFVTNDAATIVNELEVQHPAAKILVLAGKAQQEEIGDGANLTISFAGELLQNAEELIRMGLHPSEIISGYSKAINKVSPCLPTLCFINLSCPLDEFPGMLVWLSFPSLQTVEILEELVEKDSEKMDVRSKELVISRMKSSVASKQFGLEDILCPLIADVTNLLSFVWCLLVFYLLICLMF